MTANIEQSTSLQRRIWQLVPQPSAKMAVIAAAVTGLVITSIFSADFAKNAYDECMTKIQSMCAFNACVHAATAACVGVVATTATIVGGKFVIAVVESYHKERDISVM